MLVRRFERRMAMVEAVAGHAEFAGDPCDVLLCRGHAMGWHGAAGAEALHRRSTSASAPNELQAASTAGPYFARQCSGSSATRAFTITFASRTWQFDGNDNSGCERLLTRLATPKNPSPQTDHLEVGCFGLALCQGSRQPADHVQKQFVERQRRPAVTCKLALSQPSSASPSA